MGLFQTNYTQDKYQFAFPPANPWLPLISQEAPLKNSPKNLGV